MFSLRHHACYANKQWTIGKTFSTGGTWKFPSRIRRRLCNAIGPLLANRPSFTHSNYAILMQISCFYVPTPRAPLGNKPENLFDLHITSLSYSLLWGKFYENVRWQRQRDGTVLFSLWDKTPLWPSRSRICVASFLRPHRNYRSRGMTANITLAATFRWLWLTTATRFAKSTNTTWYTRLPPVICYTYPERA